MLPLLTMMTTRRFRLVAAAPAMLAGVIAVAGVIGPAGCVTHDLGRGDDDGGGDDGGGKTPAFDGALDYERSGGFISTRTNLHIDAAGKMTWTNTDGSTTTTTLPAATLGDLRHKVDQAEFLTLEPVYHCSCNDDILHKIQVLIAGAPRMVVVDDSSDYPARLRPLIDLLSGMTKTARSRE